MLQCYFLCGCIGAILLSFRNGKIGTTSNMKFCFKLGKTATETNIMLQNVNVETTVTNKTIFNWFKRFREGNESL